MSDRDLWEDNSVQFPRLLCEIMATQDVDFSILAEAMDLEVSDLDVLFDRAHEQWESMKLKHCPIKREGR